MDALVTVNSTVYSQVMFDNITFVLYRLRMTACVNIKEALCRRSTVN